MTLQRQHTSVTTRSVDSKNLTVDIIASTPSVDSYGTIIDPNGWDLSQFKRNPVITWAHDDRGFTASDGLPIANAIPETVRVENGQLKMRLRFTPEDVNPFGYKVFRMIAEGFLHGVSVGFNPDMDNMETMLGEDGQSVRIYRSSKLLETAVVTIPSNDDALVQRARQLNREDELTKIRSLAKEVEELAREERAVPKNVSTEKAPESDPWEAPSLGDFTSKGWGDLSDAEKTHIAGHYAWAKELPPAAFGDLKLPHHDPKTGKVVFRGVAAAAGRLNQADIPSGDMPKVKAHLRAHYEAFGKDVPDALEEGGKEDSKDKAKEEKSAEIVKVSVDLQGLDAVKQLQAEVERIRAEHEENSREYDKYKSYFERKQPANKAATRVLKKFYQMRGDEPPADEVEAWKGIEEGLEKLVEEVKSEEAKIDEVKVETPAEAVTPSTEVVSAVPEVPQESAIVETPTAAETVSDTSTATTPASDPTPPPTVPTVEEAPPPARKAFVQLPLPVLLKLRQGQKDAVREAAEEALRQGVPLEKLGEMFSALNTF